MISTNKKVISLSCFNNYKLCVDCLKELRKNDINKCPNCRKKIEWDKIFRRKMKLNLVKK